MEMQILVAAHHAGHLATDLLVEHGPPRNEAEAQSIVDHGETAARKLRGIEKVAADRLALVDGPEGEAAFGCELPADALELLAREGADKVGFDPQLALRRPAGVPLADELIGAPLEGFTHLGAESAGRQRAAIAAKELTIEPSRAVTGHLVIEVIGAENPQLSLAAP